MARIPSPAASSGHTLLVVDDDADLRVTLATLLRGEGHVVLEAEDGVRALQVCRETPVSLMLLDYFMPGLTGAQVVEQVRMFDASVQIVLQTGYASERPPRRMLAELDIQGFHDKSEGPDRLLVWVDAALKSYRHVRALDAAREGLEFVLRATPALHRLQPVEDLLAEVVVQVQRLLSFTLQQDQTGAGAEGAGMPVDALLVLAEETPGGKFAQGGGAATPRFEVRVATGRFAGLAWPDLDALDQRLLLSAVSGGPVHLEALTALPLQVGPAVIGALLLGRSLRRQGDLQLLEIFASQAAVAIQNVRLYALATVDDLTGLTLKRPWLAQLHAAVTSAVRERQVMGVLVIDIDHFKRVNDSYGHLAGDRVLAALGALLGTEVRSPDVVGRYGGEELVVLLPHTNHSGALVLAERLLGAVRNLTVPWEDAEIRVTVSIGLAVGSWADGPVGGDFASQGLVLLGRADAALYRAKQSGRDRVCSDPVRAGS